MTFGIIDILQTIVHSYSLIPDWQYTWFELIFCVVLILCGIMLIYASQALKQWCLVIYAMVDIVSLVYFIYYSLDDITVSMPYKNIIEFSFTVLVIGKK